MLKKKNQIKSNQIICKLCGSKFLFRGCHSMIQTTFLWYSEKGEKEHQLKHQMSSQSTSKRNPHAPISSAPCGNGLCIKQVSFRASTRISAKFSTRANNGPSGKTGINSVRKLVLTQDKKKKKK